jgi:hypothetical protein
MSDHFENWDAFDYLAVAGAALCVGGLGSALFRATRRGAVLLPAGLACLATAAYGARRNGVALSSPHDRGENPLISDGGRDGNATFAKPDGSG